MAAEIEDYGVLVKNNKLDISKKELVTLKGISKCKEVTWLDVSNNQLDSLQWLKKLKQLIVLKASGNKIADIRHILHLENLKALILNNNCIQSVEGIEKLSSLNSLVLSHNMLQTMDVSNCRNLTKLSLSHNSFQQFPNIEHLSNLKELRLNDNHIKDIPPYISSCKQLKLIDIGNNGITSFGFLETLSEINVENLNLKGNEICSLTDYKEKVLHSLPCLRVLDGRRIEREEKKKSDMVPSNSGKDTSIEEQNVVKSLTDSFQGKPKKIKIDSKPAKVGGFVSRFTQNTKNPEASDKAGKGPESKMKKKGQGDTGGVLGNLDNTRKEVSRQKKRKHKDVDNFDVPRTKKEKVILADADNSEAMSSNQEVTDATEGSSKKDTQDLSSVDVLKISSKLKKPEEKVVKKNLDSLSKQKKISRGKGAKGKGYERTIDESGSKAMAENSVKIAGIPGAMPSEEENKLENGRNEQCRAKSKAASKKKKKSTKRSDLDMRSGVLGVKVIKRKDRVGKPINVEALERNKDYDFGVGEGSGW